MFFYRFKAHYNKNVEGLHIKHSNSRYHFVTSQFITSMILFALGSVCFGCKWFQEIIFRKIGCLVGFENRIFRKSFLFDRKKEALTIEIHFHSYFHFKWFPERERERRESPDHAFDITDEPRAPIQRSHAPDYTDLVNHSIVPIAPRRSISPSTHQSLSLCVILIFVAIVVVW